MKSEYDFRAMAILVLIGALVGLGLGIGCGVILDRKVAGSAQPDLVRGARPMIHSGDSLPELKAGKAATVLYYNPWILPRWREAFWDDGINRWIDDATREILPAPENWIYDPLEAVR